MPSYCCSSLPYQTLFRSSEIPGVAHRVAERRTVFQRRHDEAERAGEAAEDLRHAVARLLQLGERVEHRQSGAGRRFVAQRDVLRSEERLNSSHTVISYAVLLLF